MSQLPKLLVRFFLILYIFEQLSVLCCRTRNWLAHLVHLQSKGFGKASSQPKIINTRTSITSKTTVKKSFVGIGKPMNDINKPEYDDQGYTLYADETTGEKSRVFEALVDYPSVFKMKIIGANESTFSSDMRQIVADSCNVSFEEVKYTERLKGKWLSVTVHAPVENAEMLYSLYENVDKDPRVKFKF